MDTVSQSTIRKNKNSHCPSFMLIEGDVKTENLTDIRSNVSKITGRRFWINLSPSILIHDYLNEIETFFTKKAQQVWPNWYGIHIEHSYHVSWISLVIQEISNRKVFSDTEINKKIDFFWALQASFSCQIKRNILVNQYSSNSQLEQLMLAIDPYASIIVLESQNSLNIAQKEALMLSAQWIRDHLNIQVIVCFSKNNDALTKSVSNTRYPLSNST